MSTDTNTAADDAQPEDLTRVIAIRTTPAQYDHIAQQAHRLGLRPSVYGRFLMLQAMRDLERMQAPLTGAAA